MRALVPTGNADLMVRLADDVEEPEPRPDELVIEVSAFSINRGETFLLRDPQPGWRPGKDVVGRVVRSAANGQGPAVGTRVVAHVEQGGWAERVAAPREGVAVLPDTTSFELAAALPLAGLTALRLLRTAGSLASRDVLLTGASGGVGHYLVELAAHQGARVIVVTATPDRAQRLLELGATGVVHDIADASGPFDVVMESTGGDAVMAALRATRPGGQVIWFGQAGLQRPVLDFFDWDVPLGVTLHRFGYQDPAWSDADDLATLVRLVERGSVHPEVGLQDDWHRTADALQHLLARRIRGNAVLTVAQD